MESDVEFVAVDNPHANKLTIHISDLLSRRRQLGITAGSQIRRQKRPRSSYFNRVN
jgi:hypothetical protein